MGELLSKDMLADLIINLINIIVLFLVTKKLLYKPVKKYLEARKQKLADSFAQAENIKAEAEAAKARYDAVLSDADEEKSKILKTAKAEADANARAVTDNAQAEAERIVAEAKEKARRDHDKAIEESKDDIADIALQISEKIMGRSVTDEDNKRIIAAFFGE